MTAFKNGRKVNVCWLWVRNGVWRCQAGETRAKCCLNQAVTFVIQMAGCGFKMPTNPKEPLCFPVYDAKPRARFSLVCPSNLGCVVLHGRYDRLATFSQRRHHECGLLLTPS